MDDLEKISERLMWVTIPVIVVLLAGILISFLRL